MTSAESSLEYRNPSPPPDERPERSHDAAPYEDRVGDTVFSKAWVLSLLRRTVDSIPDAAVSEVSKEPAAPVEDRKTEDGDGSKVNMESPKVNMESSKVSSEEEEDLKDSLFEEELCALWDASTNVTVAEFIHSYHGVELLLGVALRSSSLRIMEVCVGIVGNMACAPQVCLEAICSQEAVEHILSLFEEKDTRILTECTRLVLTCLFHQDTREPWLRILTNDPDRANTLLDSITFTLASSTNEDLLKNSALLLDQILYSSDVLLKRWTSSSLVEAICEALEQINFSCLQVCGTLFLSLQLLTTTDQGTSSLVSCVKKLRPLSLQYLLSLDHIDDTNSQTALAAASILDVLNRPSSSSDPSALGAEAIEHLQRLHSEVAMTEGAATATAAAAAAEVGGVKEEKVKVTLKQLLEQLLENSKRQ